VDFVVLWVVEVDGEVVGFGCDCDVVVDV